MDKRDCIWVAIRVFGIFLLVHALMAIPSLVSSAYQVCSYWLSSPPAASSSSGAAVRESFSYSQGMLFRSTLGMFLSAFLQLVVYFVGGMYLLRGGDRLFSWICPSQTQGK